MPLLTGNGIHQNAYPARLTKQGAQMGAPVFVHIQITMRWIYVTWLGILSYLSYGKYLL